MSRRLVVGITSVGTGIGQAVVDSLAEVPGEVRVVGLEARDIAFGPYHCDVAHRVPLSSSPDFLPRVLELCHTERIDVLIPGSDFEVVLLARCRETLAANGVAAVVGEAEAVELCRDKLALARHLLARGAPFAATLSLGEAVREGHGLGWPVVLKPRRGSGSVGVRLVVSDDELARLARRLPPDQYIVQRFLPDRSWPLDPAALTEGVRSCHGEARIQQEEEVSYQLVLAPGGRVVGTFASVNRLKAGVPTVVEPVDDGEIEVAARRVLDELPGDRLAGPLNLQGRRTPDGVAFFEVNPRFTGITGIRALMGFNEVAMVLHACCGWTPPHARLLSSAPDRSLVGVRQVRDMVVPRRAVEAFQGPAGWDRFSAPCGRVLVTGASGYLGHELVWTLLERELAEEVIAVVRDPGSAAATWAGHPCRERLHVVRWDLGFEPAPDLPHDLAAVIHLAAARPLPRTAAEDFTRVNIHGTRQLVRMAKARRIPRFILASSHAVYGTRQTRPWSEGSPRVLPETCYGASKAAAEVVVEDLDGTSTRWAAVRLAGLYGAGDRMRADELVHRFALDAAEGRPLVVFGDGSRERDLIHVRDAVAALTAQLTAPETRWNHVVNAGGGAPVAIGRLAATCARLAEESTGREVPVHFEQAEAQLASLGMSVEKARRTIGWRPQVALEDGLRELISLAGRRESPSFTPSDGVLVG